MTLPTPPANPASEVGSKPLTLTVGRDTAGRLLAIISTGGHPQIDPEQPVLLLDAEIVQSHNEAKKWFNRMKIERPWETRQ